MLCWHFPHTSVQAIEQSTGVVRIVESDAWLSWPTKSSPAGFYLESGLFPTPRVSQPHPYNNEVNQSRKLLLGPFCGKPACQFINITPGKARGVCADAFIQRRTALVPDVESFPGHIACDGETKSEIVCPLILRRSGEEDAVLGVLDLDCLALGGFDQEDQTGLEKITQLVVKSCDW